jgi:hypothetical protein
MPAAYYDTSDRAAQSIEYKTFFPCEECASCSHGHEKDFCWFILNLEVFLSTGIYIICSLEPCDETFRRAFQCQGECFIVGKQEEGA